MSAEEALNTLNGYHHCFLGKEQLQPIHKALTASDHPEEWFTKEIDTRWMFKGLSVSVSSGFLDLHEFRKWMKENWYWVKNERSKKTTQTHLVDELWMAYTLPAPAGMGLPGVPYAEGIDATLYAAKVCKLHHVDYQYAGGRGFQMRECVRALKEFYGIGEEK